MIVPGNIRERPRALDRVALGYQITDDLFEMVVEALGVKSLASSRCIFETWEGVDLPQVKDRCAIVRQELDIMKRLLKLPDNHEIHDSH
jgi:hypothetical protein